MPRVFATNLLLFAAALLLPATAFAQEVLPDAPPELEGFRLDQPAPETTTPPAETAPPSAAEPVPAPTSAQPETARPAPSTTESSAPPPQRRPSQPPPARNMAPPKPDADEPASSVIESIPPDSALAQPPDAEIDSNDAGPAPTGDAAAEAGEISSSLVEGWLIWFAISAIAALMAGALLLLAFRRRKRAKSLQMLASDGTHTIPSNASIAEIDDMDDPHVEIAEIETVPLAPVDLEPAPDKKPKSRPRAKPELDMRFVPEIATLGLVNLTLCGQLKIVNHGKAMARNVRLRSAAICASADQHAKIDAFNAGEIGREADVIDNIRKGERLSVNIEISLPRSELESYNVEGRLICVPIILAEIAYSDMRADSGQHVQIAAMIGRESNPPQDKMGPLRIDLGPRSYDALGLRPVTA